MAGLPAFLTWCRPSLEGILEDYSDDAVLIVQSQVYRGKDGARQVFAQLLADVPEAEWNLSTVFDKDVLALPGVRRCES